MIKTSTNKAEIKFLMLEGIHPSAVAVLKAAGYTEIESLSRALVGDELKARIADVHFVGIRSRTQLNAAVLAQATKLAAVGCFCIGTNQVDLQAALARREALHRLNGGGVKLANIAKVFGHCTSNQAA